VTRKTKNYTFSLPPELLDRLKKHAQKGYVPSVNSAVKEAIETYVVQIDKEYLRRQMEEAAENPDFINDLESTMADFSYADYETTGDKKKK
jgi:predicted DNA-binding protein